MRILRNKNIFGLLFAVLLAIPMIDIAVRCIYVQSNKNAKDSYSEYVSTENVKLQNGDVVYSGQLITISRNDVDTIINGQQFYVLDGNTNFHTALNTGYSFPIKNINLIMENNLIRLQYYDMSNTQYNLFKDKNSYWSFYLVNKYDVTIGANAYYYNVFLSNNTLGTLDNAFEYSVNQFITNNNFGKLNFFNWFTSLFFDNNAKANTYMQFANWYMNYALLISLAYILFMVLMWFINFVRKLLDKGLSFGEGSY